MSVARCVHQLWLWQVGVEQQLVALLCEPGSQFLPPVSSMSVADGTLELRWPAGVILRIGSQYSSGAQIVETPRDVLLQLFTMLGWKMTVV
jgi:hypothetical protein